MTCTTFITRLQPHQALHIPLDAHTTLRVNAGTVVVRQPMRWLGETVVAPVVRLEPGQSCRIDHGGWVEIRAQGGDAEVQSHRRLPAWFAAWQALRRLVKQGLPHPQKEIA
ncbi:MAG: hypothetical protein EOP76_15610 [Variovorax sp.]|jgi:hypothetical protein|nr:MAG: hypothetical protein EOP76_15610 [Variovorax sp.]